MLKFFLNASNRGYLRNLQEEFGESSNAIRLELNRFEEAGMLKSKVEGNRKYFQANRQHPLFTEVQGIVQKFVGIDRLVENVIERLGNIQRVFLEGRLAKGLETSVIDMVLVGRNIDRHYLTRLIEKAEEMMDKHIRYVIITPEEEQAYMDRQDFKPLLIWSG